MKRFVTALMLVLFPALAGAIDWMPIGPSNVEVNNFRATMSGDYLATSDGIRHLEADNWVAYTNGGLPVWEILEFDSDHVLLIMGDGSWSDGIYLFNRANGSFEVQEWAPWPNFLYHFNNIYYVGYEYGVMTSTDGQNWTDMPYFSMKECVAMAGYEDHLVISEVGDQDHAIHTSADNGQTWTQAPAGGPVITDITFTYDAMLFGIFPDHSNSSGLWRSTDFGQSWQVETWIDGLSSVYFIGIDLFVGWESNGGVGWWHPDYWEMQMINGNLPNLNINNLTQHDFLSCINIIACTDAGAYINCDFTATGIGDEAPTALAYEFASFPNPWLANSVQGNSHLTISFNLPQPERIELTVYNAVGQRVKTLLDAEETAGHHGVVWSGQDEEGRPVGSGLYLARLQTESGTTLTRRLTLLK